MAQQEAQYIPVEVRRIVKEQVDLWQGEDIPVGYDWVNKRIDNLNGADKPIAKLALLSAFAPYRVGDTVVNEFQAECPGDRVLRAVTAWASFAAVRKVGTWMWQA
ncbi:hypothetical protein MNBD_GAMMA11-1095 [hydrothermal vent metagenome]|uniref:Uncharacterized protein n=1 Tax=hydrothermal vent metagenome TaxID=652676 RepID=A0A3B0X6D2_9ZZZZ